MCPVRSVTYVSGRSISSPLHTAHCLPSQKLYRSFNFSAHLVQSAIQAIACCHRKQPKSVETTSKAMASTEPKCMNRSFRYAAVLAAIGVLVVLVTPALDELPCTTAHKLPIFFSFVVVVAFFSVLPLLSPIRAAVAAHTILPATDLLSFTCVRLC